MVILIIISQVLYGYVTNYCTGTTWLCQIVSLLLAGEERYDQTKCTALEDRALYLELRRPGCKQAMIHELHTVPVPRADKTHLPFRFVKRWLTRDNVRTIVSTRNPKDTLVSLFHFYQSLIGKACLDRIVVASIVVVPLLSVTDM